MLAFTGALEVVFDWSVERCDGPDVPDHSARAYRDHEGVVHLQATHHVGRRASGPDLDNVTHDCTLIWESDNDADPSMFNDWEWPSTPYTEDGRTVFLLVHNEYQGHTHAGECPSADYFNCWYNTVTLGISTDGGKSYEHAAPPPGHRVAGLPHRYVPDAGPTGVFEPSNIVKHQDGYYYAFVRTDDRTAQTICLMRTADLAQPSSWRAWDGSGFEHRFIDPYREELDSPSAHRCTPIDPNDLGVMNDSLTYNTYLGRYVMVGATAVTHEGRTVWGVVYSFSEDLIDWTPRKLLWEVDLNYFADPPGTDKAGYPSLLDPESTSLSFSTTGKTGYLYVTRFNQSQGTNDNRDLVRIPVEFFSSEDEAESAGATVAQVGFPETVEPEPSDSESDAPATGPSPVLGAWESLDTDRSRQWLWIEEGGPNSFTVTYYDNETVWCAEGEGPGPPLTFRGTAPASMEQVVVTPATLDCLLPEGRDPRDNVVGTITLKYWADRDALLGDQLGGAVWQRSDDLQPRDVMGG